MSQAEGARQRALKYLFDKCGFQFDEASDLSPETRQRIGDLAKSLLGIEEFDSRIQAERTRGARGTPLAKAPAAFGVLLIIAGFASPLLFDEALTETLIIGFALIVLAALASRRHKGRVARAVAKVEGEKNEQWTAWVSRADALAGEVMDEASATYQQKVRPRVIEVKVDFAELIRVAHGKGIVLDKVSCPSCGAAVGLPSSGDAVKCTYCGTTLTATNVLEKMKSLLA